MIDSHFHSLEMQRKGCNVNQTLEKCFLNGLTAGLDIGTEADDIEKRKSLIGSFPNVYCSIGLSPSEAAAEEKAMSRLLEVMERHIQTHHPAAIGETGLDWFHNYAGADAQKNLFRGHIELANRYHLPIIVHNRDADDDVLRVFSETPPQAGGIMHCYSSDYEHALRFTDYGLYISFAGNITYKKAEKIRETAVRIPIDALLIETDSPYLTPQPKRGRPNHPGMVRYTYEFIAELRNIDVELLEEKTEENFSSFIRRGKNGMQQGLR